MTTIYKFRQENRPGKANSIHTIVCRTALDFQGFAGTLPKILDESTSALDPISTGKIEELAVQLKEKYTVVMVTHNMQQAVRISDRCAFFLLGELIEFGATEKMFSEPADRRTEDYITGRFG